MRFPCPVCGEPREAFDASCTACGWVRRASSTQIVAPPPAPSWLPTIAGGLAILAALVGAVGAWRYSRSVGARCTDDFQCNTHACLMLTGLDAIFSPTVGMCTRTCTKDEDCPEDMTCDRALRGTVDTRTNRRRMCSPTGARLIELLR